MKISLERLRAYVDLPPDDALRPLFDDVGLEVKRAHRSERGLTFTLELLANRGDHRCYAGVARELAARLRAELRLPSVSALTIGAVPHPVRVETDKCLVYTLTALEKAGEGALDVDSQRILDVAGSSTGLLPVDATILAGLELGQPTHAFDADTIEGDVTVRLSRPGERAWPLFAPGPVEVPAGSVVIADDAKILAIAGVIGCEESKTTTATKRILLESATFDPPSVRIAARALGLSTDASGRFERGGDPTAPLVGAGRVVHLLEARGWTRVGATGVAGRWTDPDRRVFLDLARASTFLGVPLTAKEASDILGRFGFGCTEVPGGLDVRVPGVRLWDVEHVADLHEELAKAIGYNALPTGLPPIDAGKTPSEAELRRERVEEVLLSEGFFEVVTNGFYSRHLMDALGVSPGHPLHAHVETLNALDRGYSLLKNNTLAQAVETVAHNVRLKNPNVRAFEWTRTFHPTGKHDLAAKISPARERSVLWLVASGPVRPDHWGEHPKPVDAWYTIGLVEAIATELRLPLRIGKADPSAPTYSLLHPHRQGTVTLDGVAVGVFGEIHPSIVQNLKLRQSAQYLELDAAAVLGAPAVPYAYVEPPAMPPMQRQLSFNVPHGVEAGAVVDALRAHGPAWLEDVRVVDLYLPPDEAVRALTFDLRITTTRERTADEVNAAVLQLVATVEAKVAGVTLRA